jgi:hypothetical protein
MALAMHSISRVKWVGAIATGILLTFAKLRSQTMSIVVGHVALSVRLYLPSMSPQSIAEIVNAKFTAVSKDGTTVINSILLAARHLFKTTIFIVAGALFNAIYQSRVVSVADAQYRHIDQLSHLHMNIALASLRPVTCATQTVVHRMHCAAVTLIVLETHLVEIAPVYSESIQRQVARVVHRRRRKKDIFLSNRKA